VDRVAFTIDGREVSAPRGTKLLWAARDAGVYIPHLCAVEEAQEPLGACRLCFVEIEGEEEPAVACNVAVAQGMAVRTGTPAVRRLVRRSFELILSAHPVSCKGCRALRACGLREVARRAGLSMRRPPHARAADLPVDDSHPLIRFDPRTCVLCGRCVRECNEVEKAHAIDFARRGMELRVSTFMDGPLAESPCTSCMRCVRACPVGAFSAKSEEST